MPTTPDSSEVKTDLRELGVVERRRLEFLVDGIFAIAMTILVLDLRVPELTSGADVASLGRALLSSRATFGSYLLSFSVLGVLWYRQNRVYRYVQRVTTTGYVLYLIQLAAAAAFPFCAALLGRHFANPLAVAIYAGCIAVYNWASFGFLFLTVRDSDLQRTVQGHTLELKRQRRSVLVVTVVFAWSILWALLAGR